jgi:hypothetical protein
MRIKDRENKYRYKLFEAHVICDVVEKIDENAYIEGIVVEYKKEATTKLVVSLKHGNAMPDTTLEIYCGVDKLYISIIKYDMHNINIGKDDGIFSEDEHIISSSFSYGNFIDKNNEFNKNLFSKFIVSYLKDFGIRFTE